MSTHKYLFFVFLAFPLLASAQPDSSKFFLRLTGGYADFGTSNGAASLGAVSSANRQWDVGLSAGFAVGKHWEVGVGFEYQKQKTGATSIMIYPDKWVAIQHTETDVNLVVGEVYIAGHWRLFSKLYFYPSLTFGFGKANESQLSVGSAVKQLDESVFTPLGEFPSLSNGSDVSYDYTAINLAPTFSYFFNKHFALNLVVGSFQFSTTDWEWDNKQWIASVNPSYWKLGVIVAF